MKLLLLIPILIIALQKGFTQDTPVTISFVEAKPLWVHTAVDTTFVPIPNQVYWTKYTSIRNGPIQRKNLDLFILSSSAAPKSLYDYGFVLDRIDFKTGKRIWTHHNTLYNKGNEDFYHQINFAKDGNIELFGVEQVDKVGNKSIRKTIDFNNGKLLKVQSARDSFHKSLLYTRHYDQYILHSDSLYLTAIHIGEVGGTSANPTYDYGVTLKVSDKNLNFLSTTRQLYNFDSLAWYSINQPSYIEQLNAKTLVSIAYKERFETFENRGTKIMWSDISDVFNPKITRILELNTFLPGTKEKFILQRFRTQNNTIYLSHRYPNFDIQKNICYILWLDSVGKIKTYIPIPKYKEHYYEVADLLYANDNFAYLYAMPSITGRQGMDILQIQHGVDSVKYISSLTAIPGQEYGFIDHHVLYEDGYFIVGGYCKTLGQPEKAATKYHCFKASDLGIDFKITASKEKDKTIEKFSIYPNPTDGVVFIKIDGIESQFIIKIYDQIGREIKSIPTNDRYTQIDLSNIQNGIYFVKIVDKLQNKTIKIEKIVKIE